MRLSLAVSGRPGPKGSVNAFCTRCAKRHLPPAVVVKEESEVGAAFRKLIARQCRDLGEMPLTGIETIATIFIDRQHEVRGGVTQLTYVPSSRTAWPIHRNSGDIEKHVRVLHDALQDAGVLADDCLVVHLDVWKLWANEEHPAGVNFTVRALDETDRR